MTDLTERLRQFGALIRESQGIAGYHLNGDIEPWGDLEASPDEAADEIDRLRKMVEAAFVEGFGYGKIATSPMHVMGAWHLSKSRAELQEAEK